MNEQTMRAAYVNAPGSADNSNVPARPDDFDKCRTAGADAVSMPLC